MSGPSNIHTHILSTTTNPGQDNHHSVKMIVIVLQLENYNIMHFHGIMQLCFSNLECKIKTASSQYFCQQ